MTAQREPGEAKAVAALFSDLDDQPLGYVYQWDTGELSLLSVGELSAALRIHPALEEEVVERARPTTPPELISYLMELTTVTP